jgi:hypothetical protein
VSDDNKHQSPASLNADSYRRHVERELGKDPNRNKGYVYDKATGAGYSLPEKTTRTDGSVKGGVDWGGTPYDWDEADDMCPNCVTPWKCNGPHELPEHVVQALEDPDLEEAYDDSEQDVLMHVFCEMLWAATRDGGKKREAGTKVPWWKDTTHMAAVWSHFRKRAQSKFEDSNSGAHPYVHAAWRLLAIAYQETHGQVDPEAGDEG